MPRWARSKFAALGSSDADYARIEVSVLNGLAERDSACVHVITHLIVMPQEIERVTLGCSKYIERTTLTATSGMTGG